MRESAQQVAACMYSHYHISLLAILSHLGWSMLCHHIGLYYLVIAFITYFLVLPWHECLECI
jgi:hypothetical protein